MTVHALVVAPPRPELALQGLVGADGESLLEPEAASTLAGAMIQDAAVAVERSGGDLLVNHPTADQLPGDQPDDVDPAVELRALLTQTQLDLDDVRFEPQVGSTVEARIGNTFTHLLREEGAASVAWLDGRTPTLDHTALDSAAMKLRRADAVVGPAPGGRVAYLGLAAPIDFSGAWQSPELRTLVSRAIDAGHEVDFLPMHPRVDDAAGLHSLVSIIEARRAAGRRVPEYTAAAIDALGLRVVPTGEGTTIVAEVTDRA